jgi:hypothetical protein
MVDLHHVERCFGGRGCPEHGFWHLHVPSAPAVFQRQGRDTTAYRTL